MSFWIHPDAEAELGDAAVHYASHAGPAIAESFLAEFERVRDFLIENPYSGPEGDDGLRVCHFERFPYTLVYEPDALKGPQIYAVAHQHRAPAYWLYRV